MSNFSEWSENEVLETLIGRAKTLNLTNYKLSKETGISQSTISRYFNGEVKFSLASFLKLCKALKLSMFLTPNENMIEEIDSSAFK